jgi:hypothetical protein
MSRRNLFIALMVALFALTLVSPIFSRDNKPGKPDSPGQSASQDQGNGNGNAGNNGGGNGNGNNGNGNGNNGGDNGNAPSVEQPTLEVTDVTVSSADADVLGCQKNNPERLDCSSLEVSGVCESGVAVFTIRNTGEAGNGDMLAATSYRLVVDGVVVESGAVQLAGGATMTIQYSGGGTVTLEADQQIGHPGSSHPRTTLSCGEPVATEPPNTETPTAEPTEPEVTPTEDVTPTDEPTPTEEVTPPVDEPVISAVAYCIAEDGSISFVISNSGANMTSAAYYTVTDQDGNLAGDGWIQLYTNENLSLTYWGYTALTLVIGDLAVTSSVDCGLPSEEEPTPVPDYPILSAEAYCVDATSILFYISNSGSDMTDPVWYYVVDFNGNFITEGQVQLLAGEYTSIYLSGNSGLTMVVGDFQASAYIDCTGYSEEPTPTPDPTEEGTPTPEPTEEGTPSPEPTEEGTPTPTPDPSQPLGCQKNNETRLDCSSLAVSGYCEGGVAVFTIRNTGEAGDGDMRAATEYRIIVDGVVVETGTVQIAGRTSMTVEYSGGGTVTLEADQQIGHPGKSQPQTTLNCTA